MRFTSVSVFLIVLNSVCAKFPLELIDVSAFDVVSNITSQYTNNGVVTKAADNIRRNNLSLYKAMNDNDNVKEEISDILKAVKNIEGRIENMGHQFTTVEKASENLLIDYKFAEYFRILRTMKSQMALFKATLAGYGNDDHALQQKLTSFAENYKHLNLASELVHSLVDRTHHGSPVEYLSSRTESFLKDFSRDKITSTKQMIFDFYTSAIYHVFESDLLMRFCFELRANMLNESTDNDYAFLNATTVGALDLLMDSFRTFSSQPNQDALLIVPSNLMKNAPRKIEFLNVVQLECLKDCGSNAIASRHDRCEHDGQRSCEGTRFDCSREVINTEELPDVDCEQLNNRNRFLRSNMIAEYALLKTSRSVRDFCFCDSENYAFSHRKVYTGVIRPRHSAYVITGVRFQKELKTLYLQIQVGQLVSGGKINASTVHWQESPEDLLTKFIEVNRNQREFLLDDIYFQDAALVGVQLQLRNDQTIGFNVYGRRMRSLSEGLLEESEISVHSEGNFHRNVIDFQWKTPGLDLSKSLENLEVKRGSDIKFVLRFGVSNKYVDAGQSFVPFFDGSDTVSDTPSALSGLGLLHYTNNNDHAGYVKPYIRAYDLFNEGPKVFEMHTEN